MDATVRCERIVLAQVTRRFRITGRVQGVYFRHSARMEAERLALAGYARNLPDGSVEVVAQGPVAAVEQLRQWLHQGPKMARVEAVLELALEPDAAPPPHFEIL
ncbi:MAG: acylphosphatase [Steroidobacteraceae bacterium]